MFYTDRSVEHGFLLVPKTALVNRPMYSLKATGWADMLRLFAVISAVMLVFLPDALGQSRDVYTVRSIVVDERAPTVVEAREQAFAAARLAGAQIMIDRITLPENRVGEQTLAISQAVADRLAAAVDIEEETAGAGRYRGRLAVVFNPFGVRAFLSAAGIPYLDQQAGRAVLIPVDAEGSGEEWNSVWADMSSGRLVPTVTSRSSIPPRARNWASVEAQALYYGLQRVILAELVRLEDGYMADIYSLTPDSTRKIANTPVVATLEETAALTAILLDTDWKRASIVRQDTETSIEARIVYTSLLEWNKLRRVLTRSPLISGFQIQTITTTGATVIFTYNGDENSLVADLRDRGVSIDTVSDSWQMRSAIGGGD